MIGPRLALGEEGWARAVIAAAVRAYVPQLDAHGAWAPLDEELSFTTWTSRWTRRSASGER